MVDHVTGDHTISDHVIAVNYESVAIRSSPVTDTIDHTISITDQDSQEGRTTKDNTENAVETVRPACDENPDEDFNDSRISQTAEDLQTEEGNYTGRREQDNYAGFNIKDQQDCYSVPIRGDSEGYAVNCSNEVRPNDKRLENEDESADEHLYEESDDECNMIEEGVITTGNGINETLESIDTIQDKTCDQTSSSPEMLQPPNVHPQSQSENNIPQCIEESHENCSPNSPPVSNGSLPPNYEYPLRNDRSYSQFTQQNQNTPVDGNSNIAQLYQEPPPCYPQNYSEVSDQKETAPYASNQTASNLEHIPTVIHPSSRPLLEPYRSSSVKSETSDTIAQGQQHNLPWNYYAAVSGESTGACNDFTSYPQYVDYDRQFSSTSQGFPDGSARGATDPMLPVHPDAEDIAAYEAQQQYVASCSTLPYQGQTKQESGQVCQGHYKLQQTSIESSEETMVTQPVRRQKKVVVPAGNIICAA